MAEELDFVPKVEIDDTVVTGNRGAGRCKKVYIIWKLNMSEGVRELYCVAQNRSLCRAIQEMFREEAERYGIEPQYYVSYEERPVVWSRTVYPEKYRIYDLTNNRVVYGLKNTKDSGYYLYYKAAVTRAESLKENGELDEYCIQVYDRKKKKWIVTGVAIKKARRKLIDFTYNTLKY